MNEPFVNKKNEIVEPVPLVRFFVALGVGLVCRGNSVAPRMRLIIAGSRTVFISEDALNAYIQEHFGDRVTEVVSGCAVGMDTLGIQWAATHSVPVKRFIPDWSIGRHAGHVRNRQMGDYADEALVIYNGSKGSQGMIDYMTKLGKRCIVVNTNEL
jgi:hypothetical protein